MIKNRQTPGVYIIEEKAFPNSIVGVPTSQPAFIGYTQQAIVKWKKADNEAIKISSLLEFEQFFGKGPVATCTIATANNGTAGDLVIDNQNYNLNITPNTQYNLYNSIRLFYQNGGSYCYIVSVGDYTTPISTDALLNGLNVLENIDDVTLLVVPDAVLLPDINSFATVANAMLNQCGKLNNRFAILDVYNGASAYNQNGDNAAINAFRQAINSEYLGYGAAYYPFVNTTVVQLPEISHTQFLNTDLLAKLINPQLPEPLDTLKSKHAEAALNTTLHNASKNYALLAAALQSKLNLLPQSGAIAGIYTSVDNNRGVWKAPANVALKGVKSPTVSINHEMQQDLNAPLNGKAINVTRNFVGEGTLIWGARTLDGNSNDWRYLSARRTMIFLENSIKAAAKAYIFEPNDAATWIAVKSMINSFLFDVWKQGGLVGAKPEDAFFIEVGLGSSMTPTDILNGIMRVNVGVSLIRPAEFVIINIEQMMHKS